MLPIKLRKAPWGSFVQRILDLWRKGYAPREIAAAIGRPTRAGEGYVRHILRRHGWRGSRKRMIPRFVIRRILREEEDEEKLHSR
jgi:hypothetical protein